jgi:hypothetical protein
MSAQFDRLVVGHRCDRGSPATIVLAAVAARNGLRFDGSVMEGRTGDCNAFDAGRGASLAWVARETGLSIDTVRTATKMLLSVGEMVADQSGGLHAVAAALAERWTDHRRRISLDRRSRAAGLGPNAMLLVGLVTWATPPSDGWLRLCVEFLAERIGCSDRAVDRALSAARDVQLIDTRTLPIQGGGFRRQLLLAPRKSSSGNPSVEPGAPLGNRRPAKRDVTLCNATVEPSESVARPRGKASPGPLGNRRPAPSEIVAQPPDVLPDVLPDSPPDALPRVGEAVASLPEQIQQQKAPAAPAVLGEVHPAAAAPVAVVDPVAVVASWVTAFTRRGVERMGRQHAADVVGLLDQLGPPTGARDRAAVARERLRLGARVVAWCPSPERLGRWLLRVRRWYGAANLGAYLRRACEKGDPGTVLDSHNRIGRAVETWRDFPAATERALEGEHVVAVREIVASTAAVMAAEGNERERLRAELRTHLSAGRRAEARSTLLRLVGDDRSDMAVARAVVDVCPLAIAKELLAA